MDLGLSQTNAARAREVLAGKFFPKDATHPEFLVAISEVIERFHTKGFWVGSKSTFSISIPDSGVFFLPHFLDSIISSRVDKRPVTTFGPRYEFLYDGPGELDSATGTSGAVVDKGLSPIEAEFPATDGVPIAGVIKLTATTPDIGKKIRILGSDVNGRVITDGVPGEEVTLVNGTVNSTTSFTSIQGLQKEATQSQVSVHHVGGTDTLLAVLENYMRLPVFRSYAVSAQGCDKVIAYCKRRATPITTEEDYVVPGNLSALKLGLYARNYEEKNDRKRAKEFWQDAIDILNGEAVEYRGGVQETLEVDPWGRGISKIQNMM